MMYLCICVFVYDVFVYLCMMYLCICVFVYDDDDDDDDELLHQTGTRDISHLC